jgi:hypothetical protein
MHRRMLRTRVANRSFLHLVGPSEQRRLTVEGRLLDRSLGCLLPEPLTSSLMDAKKGFVKLVCLAMRDDQGDGLFGRDPDTACYAQGGHSHL